MDFHSILSIAQQKQEDKKNQDLRGLSTKFSAPRKEKKSKERRSEAIKKLLEEKEREKQKLENKEKQRKKEEEKAKRFRIPKAGTNGDSEIKKQAGGHEKVDDQGEEVVIHKEDFVKTSSKKRVAHNPGFHRPVIPPVKSVERVNSQSTEPEEKHRHKDGSSSKRSRSSSDISVKSSSSKSDKKHLSSSKSSSNLSEKSSSSSQSKSSHSLSSKHTNNGQNTTSLKGKALLKAAGQHQASKTGSDVKPKPRPAAPPPMGFEALLKLAEEKRKEPVKVDVVEKPVKRTEESLMTQEEKDRLIRKKSKTYQEWLKFGKSNTSPEDLAKSRQNPAKPQSRSDKNSKVGPNVKSEAIRKSNTDKHNRTKVTHEISKRKLHMGNEQSDVLSKTSKMRAMQSDRIDKSPSIKSKVNLKEKIHGRTNSAGNSSSSAPMRAPAGKPSKPAPATGLPRTKSDSGIMRTKVSSSADKGRPVHRKVNQPSTKYSSTNENVLVCGPVRSEPPKSQNPWDRIYNKIQQSRPVKRRIEDEEEEEDEDEYWSEEEDFIDDDFIDDGPGDEDDYRKHLRDMFGYSYTDRFRNFNDRDDNMESSFAQQMKEEARSTRLGKQEDLEDMRKEEEELRKKKLAKKKKLKTR